MLIPLATSAQTWCAPGAEWHWSKFGFSMDGYMHDRYVQDSIVGGRTAQHIHRSGYTILNWMSDTIPVEEDYFTTTEGSDVLLWVEHEDGWVWDTLFRFDAVPGDSWSPAGNAWNAGSCVLTVMDTAMVVLDGIPFRQLLVSFHTPEIGPLEGTQTITERIGHEWGNWSMPASCIIDGDADIFRCYHDQDINVTASNWNWGCDTGTGIRDKIQQAIIAVPNPGRSFTLEGYAGAGSVQLFDASGRSVLHHVLTDGAAVVPTEVLVPGAYHFQLLNASGVLVTRGTWVRSE